MDSFREIRTFLGVVRRRLRRRAAAVTALTALSAVALASLLAPLLAASASPAAARAIQHGAIAIGSLILVATAIFGLVIPRRQFRRDPEVARYVGRAAPEVASDLLSTVELEAEIARGPRFSSDLAVALADTTAERVLHLDPLLLVPARPLVRPAAAAGALAGLYILLATLAPGVLSLGWERLISPPASHAVAVDATSVAEPIVGDIAITLEFPKYTRRAPMRLPASSGDILAPRGTQVVVETTALRPAQSASIRFDELPPSAEVPMRVDGRRLSASFVVDKPTAFRFRLTPAMGPTIVEAEPHRIEIEPDRAPRVELFAPADELDVSSRRRVELAYSVDDDYGLSEIALVWRGETGKEERRVLPEPKKHARTAQAKFLWDLSELSLPPGSRVAYHLEAKDNDDVDGPNVGSSRTFYLRVFSPRERHEEIVEKQQEVFELAVSLLADRLELRPDDALGRQDVARATERLVVELGTLLSLLEADTLAPKGLHADLVAIRDRIEKLARDANTPERRWILELEKDVIAMDDWIARQRMEDLLSITDEIRQHRDRLKDLLERYAQTKSPELRAEIEREIRAIEQRIAELQRRAAALSGEVADRFMNHEALTADGTTEDCMAKVRALLDKGDVEGAARQLDRCSELLDAQAEALENGLRGLRGERFSDEEKAFSDLMDEVQGLEEEQDDIARRADELMDEYKKRAADATRDRANPHREKAKKILEKLDKELKEVPEGGLTPFSQEEMEAVRRRVEDVKRMLDEGDVAEAQSMARQAEQGLRVIESDLEDDLDDGEPWSDRTDEALERVVRADGIAEDLVDELERATPSPEELMTPRDRQQMSELERRQKQMRDRTRKLGQKVEKRKGELPMNAGEAAKKGLDEAAQQMERGEARMDAMDPLGSREEARGAAEKLSKLRQGLQRSSRPTSVGQGRDVDVEPVRIPGSEEYRAPEAWREDILEGARRGSAPREYREQVERYFQELIR